MNSRTNAGLVSCCCGAMHWNHLEQQWKCATRKCRPVTEEETAMRRIGAFAPASASPTFDGQPLAGYVQTGPTSYERIGPGPDFRDVWQAQFRSSSLPPNRRETEAIASAASSLLYEGARDTAIELLAATRRR